MSQICSNEVQLFNVKVEIFLMTRRNVLGACKPMIESGFAAVSDWNIWLDHCCLSTIIASDHASPSL